LSRRFFGGSHKECVGCNVTIKNNINRGESWKQWFFLFLILLLIAAVCYLFDFCFDGKFLTKSNLTVLISHAIIPAFVAWGLCFIFACEFTDMSIGAVIVIAANVSGMLGSAFGYPGIILGGIGTGMLLIAFNFFIFVKTNIPSWIAGIGLAMIYEALAVLYSNKVTQSGGTIAQLDNSLRLLAKPPYIYLVFFLGFIAAYLIYNRTQVGLNIRALGSGLKVSADLGIDIKKTLLYVGLICGFFVGCSAFLNESYNARMTAKTGLTSLAMIFQPMAALMLAQVLQSRINIIVGIPICSLLVYSIFNMLTIAGVPSGTWQEAILGFIVILFGVIAQRNTKGVVK
jgi:ribose transport system permease protein